MYASELAKSSLDVESLTIHPYLKASTDLNVESITITFDTAYPGIWWDPEYRAEFEAQFLEGEIPNELKTRDILGNLWEPLIFQNLMEYSMDKSFFWRLF